MAISPSTSPLEIYLLTFNCARTLVDPNLLGASFFSAWPRDRPELPDVVAVSLQEVAPIAYSFLGESWITPYLDRVEQSLRVASRRDGDGSDATSVYERVVAHNVGMTAAMVFVKPDVKARIGTIETAGVGVGVWEMGNKGGVGVRLDVDDTELTFVAMHLAPMEDQVPRRNDDWKDICRGLVFQPADSKQASGTAGTETQPLLAGTKRTATGLYKPGSHIFLFGDLNYRINGNKKIVEETVKQNLIEVCVKNLKERESPPSFMFLSLGIWHYGSAAQLPHNGNFN